MTLGYDDRHRIRLAIDQSRRTALSADTAAARRSEIPRCPAIALSGRPCMNRPAESGYCRVHHHSHATAHLW